MHHLKLRRQTTKPLILQKCKPNSIFFYSRSRTQKPSSFLITTPTFRVQHPAGLASYHGLTVTRWRRKGACDIVTSMFCLCKHRGRGGPNLGLCGSPSTNSGYGLPSAKSWETQLPKPLSQNFDNVTEIHQFVLEVGLVKVLCPLPTSEKLLTLSV